MAGQAMAVPYQIAAAYEQLVNALRDAAEAAGNGTVLFPKPIRGSFSTTAQSDRACFHSQLFCKAWRWRGSSKSTATVDILLEAEELIDLNEGKLLRSTVRVNYFDAKDDTARLLQCLHYDYQHPPQDGQHPVFHAQTDDRPIDPEGEMKQEFTYKVSAEKPSCFSHARIPTSDMTLGSVLLSLAADHLGAHFFQQFREQFEALQDRLPHPDIATLRANLPLQASVAHLKSSNWYCR